MRNSFIQQQVTQTLQDAGVLGRSQGGGGTNQKINRQRRFLGASDQNNIGYINPHSENGKDVENVWMFDEKSNPDINEAMKLRQRKGMGQQLSPEEDKKLSGSEKMIAQTITDWQKNFKFNKPQEVRVQQKPEEVTADKYRPSYLEGTQSQKDGLLKNMERVPENSLYLQKSGIPQWQENTPTNPAEPNESFSGDDRARLIEVLKKQPQFGKELTGNAEKNASYDLAGDYSRFTHQPDDPPQFPVPGLDGGKLSVYNDYNDQTVSGKTPLLRDNLAATKFYNTGYEPPQIRQGSVNQYQRNPGGSGYKAGVGQYVGGQGGAMGEKQVERLENRKLNVLKNLLAQDVEKWKGVKGRTPTMEEGAKVHMNNEEVDNSYEGTNKWRKSRNMEPISQELYQQGQNIRKTKYQGGK